MLLKFVRIVGVLVMCLLLNPVLLAQSWRQLALNDFQNVASAAGNGAGYIAYTNCQLQYNYDARRHNGQYELTFYVNLAVNHAKSWMDKVKAMESGHLNDILRHEQGHYNLAYLEQQELLQAFNQTRYGSNYQYQVSAIFDGIDRKYRTLNQSYEQSTQHMLNRDKQSEWNAWFASQLGNQRSYAYQER